MSAKTPGKRHFQFILILFFALFVGACEGEGKVKLDPLRGGVVVETHDIGAVTFILAQDDENRNFWVMTNVCTVGKGGRIEVLRGTHYSRIRSEDLGRTLNDVYSAQLILINGREVKGFGSEGLPANCVDLR